jgi:hypothetical protein
MFRLLVFFALLIIGLVFFYDWLKKQQARTKPLKTSRKPIPSAGHPREIWTQVFETADPEEAGRIKARLEEENIRVILFEQAKKDLQGHVPPGVGLVVPRNSVKQAQGLIFRYLENP